MFMKHQTVGLQFDFQKSERAKPWKTALPIAGVPLLAAVLLLALKPARESLKCLCNLVFAASEAVNAYAYNYFKVSDAASPVLALGLLMTAAAGVLLLAYLRGSKIVPLLAALALAGGEIWFGLTPPAAVNVLIFALLALLALPVDTLRGRLVFLLAVMAVFLTVQLLAPGVRMGVEEASSYYIKAKGYKDSLKSRGLVFAYALAVSEENAAGGRIVTAPTCGSCGVVPAVLYHLQKSREFSDTRILRALATAGLVGNIVKQNASISGAEVGCQGEVGVACAMASAAASQLFGGSPAQIEYAAEMGLEHHLGMTCDPVCGLVQIPCIERNAYAAARALDANIYSAFTDGNHRVSFDKVVAVMKQTGHDLPSLYKETGEGGLAKDYEQM